MVAFSCDTLGLTVTHTSDWFVEVRLDDGAHLSVADASRAGIAPGHGAGITLSWQVGDLAATRAALVERGLTAGTIARRWNSHYIEMHDPAGTRIELWSPTTD